MKNYAFCIGDVARQIHDPSALRGAFACRLTSRFEDITDGSANTIAMAEIGTRKGRLVTGQYAIHQAAGVLDDPRLCRRLLDSSDDSLYRSDVRLSVLGRGGRWADGAAGYGLFNTVLPPNQPSCAIGGEDAADGIYATTSYHPDGTQVLFVDASVRFMTDDVDVGDESHPTLSPEQIAEGAIVSPHGVWGALGTAASHDSIASP